MSAYEQLSEVAVERDEARRLLGKAVELLERTMGPELISDELESDTREFLTEIGAWQAEPVQPYGWDANIGETGRELSDPEDNLWPATPLDE